MKKEIFENYLKKTADYQRWCRVVVKEIENECSSAELYSEAVRMKWLVVMREHIMASSHAVHSCSGYVQDAMKRLRNGN